MENYRIVIYKDNDNNYAIGLKGDQAFRYAEVEGNFYNKLVDKYDIDGRSLPRSKNGWKKRLKRHTDLYERWGIDKLV